MGEPGAAGAGETDPGTDAGRVSLSKGNSKTR